MLQDLRYALRNFARSPGFSIAAILTLTLAIGSVTAIFSVADAILFRALPYPDSNRLVMIWDQLNKLGQDRFPLREETFTAYQAREDIFESAAAFRIQDGNFTRSGDPEHIAVLHSTSNLFAITGAVPFLGRAFAAGDRDVAILGHALFLRRFGGRAEVIGKSIRLDDRNFTVLGVLPAGFAFSEAAESPEVWIPLEEDSTGGSGRWGVINMLGKLRPGVSIAQAQATLDTVAAHLEETLRLYRGPNGEDAGYGVKVTSLRDDWFHEFRSGAWILLCVVAAVLLIAMVNVAHLFLARAASRDREFAIRRAIGAAQTRLIRQWITEAALLSFVGGVSGAILSIWGVRILVALSPAALPGIANITVNGRALGLTLTLSIAVSLLAGLSPAIRPRRSAPLLIMAETALAMTLLIVAGLLLKSFVQLSRVNVGFRPEHILTMHLDLPHAPYPEARDRIRFYSAVHDRLAAMPGVVAVGLVDRLPVNGTEGRGGNPFSIEGHPWNAASTVPQIAHTMAAGRDYFRAMQIPLVSGRAFTSLDAEKSTPVAVVNETLARGFFPEGAIGRHIMLGAPRSGYPWLTIVGVVGDVKTTRLDQARIPQFYLPLAQYASPSIALALRTTGDPLKMVRQTAAMIHSIDPERPVYGVETMEARIDSTVRQPRFVSFLAAFFATIALALSGIGIFGVVAHNTGRRTKEIGVRMALGADRGRVLRLVIGAGLRPVIAGILLGAGGALAVARALSSILYHVKPDDPATFLAATSALMASGLAACAIPARKATRIDPMAALRAD